MSMRFGEALPSESLNMDSFKLFVQANLMRINWSNSAASRLWASLPQAVPDSSVSSSHAATMALLVLHQRVSL